MPEHRSALSAVWAPGRHGSPATGAPRISFAALDGLSVIQVGAFDEAAAVAAIRNACGALPPVSCNSTTLQGDIRLFGVGPVRWLLVAPESQNLPARLIDRIPADVAAITDLSSGRTVVRVSGPDTRRMLAKLCILDLDARVFAPGRCAQTLLGQAGVLLAAVTDEVIDVFLSRSYAICAWETLADAAAEYGYSLV